MAGSEGQTVLVIIVLVFLYMYFSNTDNNKTQAPAPDEVHVPVKIEKPDIPEVLPPDRTSSHQTDNHDQKNVKPSDPIPNKAYPDGHCTSDQKDCSREDLEEDGSTHPLYKADQIHHADQDGSSHPLYKADQTHHADHDHNKDDAPNVIPNDPVTAHSEL